MPTPSKIYYGSTLIYEGGGGLWWPQQIEYAPLVNATAGGTAHTLGAWTELIASTDADADLLYGQFATSNNGNDSSTLVDIGIGAAGAETAVITSIPAGFAGPTFATEFALPIDLPAGTRVAFRARSIQAGKTNVGLSASVLSTGVAAPSSLDTIGAVTASSSATNITPVDTWVQMTASTSQAYSAVALIPTVSGGALANDAGIVFTLGIGAGGSEVELASVTCESISAEQFGPDDGNPPCVYIGDVPAGSRLAVKCNTNRAYFAAVLIGVPA